MTWKLPISGPLRVVADYSQIIIGSFLVGIGVNLFFIPNQVVSGGVTGIAILIHYAFDTPVGLVTLLLNLPLLIIGWRWAGGVRFLIRTGVAVAVLSATIDFTGPYLTPPTADRLLVICYGGLRRGILPGRTGIGVGPTRAEGPEHDAVHCRSVLVSRFWSSQDLHPMLPKRRLTSYE